MSAQIAIDGLVINLDEEITYNFQGLDVGDISVTKSNYTSTFRIPKTKQVVALFQGLGIEGDRSPYPYKINNVKCMDDYAVVYEGTLVIMRTDETHYHATVLGSVVEIASVLGDMTVADLGWEILGHVKEPNIVSTLMTYVPAGFPLIYILAKFGKYINFDDVKDDDEYQGTGTWINVDSLCPAVRVNNILMGIFNVLGLQYDLGDLDISDEYMTFPYPPYLEVGEDGLTVLTAVKTSPSMGNWDGLEFGNYQSWLDVFFDSNYFTLDSNDNWSFTCEEGGAYIINIDFYDVFVRPADYRAICGIYVNDEEKARFGGRNWNYQESNIFRTLVYVDAGDWITIKFFRESLLPPLQLWQMNGEGFGLRIIQPEVKEEAVKSTYGFRLLQFLREFMWRHALTMVKEDDTIRFISLDQLTEVDPSNVVDWSEKYVRRTEESYDLGYAHNNWFRHKYIEDGQDYFDLNVESDKVNGQRDKTVVQSDIFVRNQNNERFKINDTQTVTEAAMITYDGDDIESVNTENRNFFVRIRSLFLSNLKLGSYTIPITAETGLINVFAPEEEDTGSFVNSGAWDPLSRIVNNTRVHRIELLLNAVDVSQIDLTKVYYFEQEQSYYRINKLQYKYGEPAKGEFVKINYHTGSSVNFVSVNTTFYNDAAIPMTITQMYEDDIVVPPFSQMQGQLTRYDTETYFVFNIVQGGIPVEVWDFEFGYHDLFISGSPINIPGSVVEPINVFINYE